MYLGCNNDGCRMFDSLIERNYIHHTNGPSVTQGDGIEIKEGSYDNVVRDNVIHDTNYPCILTYSAVGNGGPNIIERNLLWNCGDHAIQSAADAIIRNNIILGAAYDGIRNQPHQTGVPVESRDHPQHGARAGRTTPSAQRASPDRWSSPTTRSSPRTAMRFGSRVPPRS